MNHSKKIILVTGASSGIGLETAKLLHQKGHKVYGASRSIENTNHSFEKITIDLNDKETIREAVDKVLAREKKIDIVVNCAGYVQYGSFLDLTISDIRRQLETNFFGHIILSQYVLKKSMIKNKSGLLITIGSIGGMIGLPYQSAYSASKFALEGFMEAVRIELKTLNIHVVLLDPGDVNTNMAVNRKFSKKEEYIEELEGQYEKTLATVERDETRGLPPNTIAKKLAQIVQTKCPKLRYIEGPLLQELALVAKKILPQKWFEKIMGNHYKVKV